jgi:ATP adenylyltransferase
MESNDASFERLWAPWRLDYVTGDKAKDIDPTPSNWHVGADPTCFLCRAAASYPANIVADRLLTIVERSSSTIALLNKYPYNNGHLLVSPKRHVGDLADLTHEEHLECMHNLTRFSQIYRTRLNAEGFNVGLNLGRVAGAGVPGHLHWHLVPRWSGDNNFMPVIADTRVISQSLEALWEFLTEADTTLG